jgi:hypothetical protein
MTDFIEPLPGDPLNGAQGWIVRTAFTAFHDLVPTFDPVPILARGVRARTVVQQRVMNCPLPALLAAMAHAMPGRLQRMISKTELPKPRDSYFFGKTTPSRSFKEMITVVFQHKTIEISPLLYVDVLRDKPRMSRFSFALSTDGGSCVSYIEKAYVVYRCEYLYKNLNFLGGSSATPLTVARVVEDVAHSFDWLRLAGKNLEGPPEFLNDADPISHDAPSGSQDEERFVHTRGRSNMRSKEARRKKVKEMFKLHKKRATIVTTLNHTLAVLDYDETTDEVHLYDALRFPSGLGSLQKIGLDAFLANHEDVFQVR